MFHDPLVGPAAAQVAWRQPTFDVAVNRSVVYAETAFNCTPDDASLPRNIGFDAQALLGACGATLERLCLRDSRKLTDAAFGTLAAAAPKRAEAWAAQQPQRALAEQALAVQARADEFNRAVRARQVGQRRRVEARGVRDGGRRVVAELDGVRGREDLVAQQPQQLRRALVAGAPRERLERAAAQRDLPTSRVPARIARKHRRRARRAPRPRGGRTCRRRPRPRRRAAARTSRCRRGT